MQTSRFHPSPYLLLTLTALFRVGNRVVVEVGPAIGGRCLTTHYGSGTPTGVKADE